MNDQKPSVSTAATRRPASNKGKLTGPKPPLRPGQVWCIRAKLQLERRVRDLALFNLAIDSKLRGCDLVALRVENVAPNCYSIDRANVRQKKTGRPVLFELTEVVNGCFRGDGAPANLTTRQYARLVGEWVSGIGLDPLKFATHSMRRTKATLIYRRTGNLRAVQLLLGHAKIESTVWYLGVEVDDALEIAEKVDVRTCGVELSCSAPRVTGVFGKHVAPPGDRQNWLKCACRVQCNALGTLPAGILATVGSSGQARCD